MMVFSLRLLPYLMVIGGISFLFTGKSEDVILGIALIVGGGLWFYKRYNNEISIEQTDTTKYEIKTATNSTVDFCGNCGSKLVEGADFCSECGRKVNE